VQPLSTIAAHFIRPYLALCGDRTAELGLDTVDFEDPEARVDYAKALRTFELAERTLGREDLGLVGAQHHAGSLRILEYLSRVCRTPLEALEKSSQYQNLIHDACLFTVENDGKTLTARMASQEGVPFSGMVADFFMASLVLGLYRLGVPPDGARVRLVRALPRDPAPFESLFRCALEFGAGENSATFPLDAMTRSNPDADSALAATLELHAERMLERLPRGDSILDQLRVHLAKNLANGATDLGQVARSLGLSDRTLRRRLQECGTHFQAVLDGVRAQQAEAYLAGTDLAVDEIAFLLGFSEASAFRRAYRRWNGRPLPSRRSSAFAAQ
jgi:AraC-like DNA-binding protein